MMMNRQTSSSRFPSASVLSRWTHEDHNNPRRHQDQREAMKTTTTTVKKTTTTTSSTQNEDPKLEQVTVEHLGRQPKVEDANYHLARRGELTSKRVDLKDNRNKSIEDKVEGNKLVTTISTIAAQSSQSRIVVAIVKDGDAFQLQVQEMRPGIFEVGANRRECVKYHEEHTKLLRNLRQQKVTPIEGWMAKYNKIKGEQPTMSSELKMIYLCMGENLNGSWRALLKQLDVRLLLLEETEKFYGTVELLTTDIDKADSHVQVFRSAFLAGPRSTEFGLASEELKRLNQQVSARYESAREHQAKLVKVVAEIAASNLADSRPNHLVADGKNLISFINAYLEPLERRKIQLESVIRSSKSHETRQSINVTRTQRTNRQTFEKTNGGQQQVNESNYLREITNFNDLNLADNWLNLKIEQLNSSLLSSLGISAQDSRSLLGKHEQIALECSAIEDATLNFKGKNIHALKSVDPQDDQILKDKSLFEQQKVVATRARDVITILDARIVLLRRTIDFYSSAKEATNDIDALMRRLQVDDSLQSVQYVANELEVKDVSSVVASGATIISELQQLQLAQKHGQRSDIVNLNLVTSGVRNVIDQLSQDLGHLKTVLNQRKMLLMNEDVTKRATNFSNKCHQLHFWLNNHAKSYLITNNKLAPESKQVQDFCDGYEQLRVSMASKTPEVEALLRLLFSLTESFEQKSRVSDQIQREADELRQDWICAANCLDRRLDLALRYLGILRAVEKLVKDLDVLDARSRQQQASGRMLDLSQLHANIDQNLVQLANQVQTFALESQKVDTSLVYLSSNESTPVRNDINKRELVAHVSGLLEKLGKRRDAPLGPVGLRANQKGDLTELRLSPLNPQTGTDQSKVTNQKPQEIDKGPRFVIGLSDIDVEPFSTVELVCELEEDQSNCKVEWTLNNLNRIPPNIKHSVSSDNHRHKLTISQFSPVCCGDYYVKATDSKGRIAISRCKLRLAGIKEQSSSESDSLSLKQESSGQKVPKEPAKSTISNQKDTSGPTNAPRATGSTGEQNMDRLVRGVNSSMGSSYESSVTRTHVTETETIGRHTIPVLQTNYSGPASGTSSSLGENLRVPYVESPVSSASLSRSVSKSPFAGTPQRPVFVQPLSDSMPSCCSRAGLVCLVVANPPPTIEWLHNDIPIATAKCPTLQTGSKTRGNICKLTIETVNPKTQGQYECRATNRLGQSCAQFNLDK